MICGLEKENYRPFCHSLRPRRGQRQGSGPRPLQSAKRYDPPRRLAGGWYVPPAPKPDVVRSRATVSADGCSSP